MFQARPLSPATWRDLEELFGLPGGSIVRGCWYPSSRRSTTTVPRLRSPRAAAMLSCGPARALEETAHLLRVPAKCLFLNLSRRARHRVMRVIMAQ
jgi:hypothetical protein